ncbi:MAG: tripartite tricarboxylate transporter substrate binding protein [Proteobacteria bacterium]|nr:tripartite tricarboxylate transporter substrate binding protein [Burkholderiales bacterium]
MLVACGIAACATAPALAQSFPSRGITVVSPFAPGGPSDLIARTMAAKLTEALAVPVVVENRGGAGATLGTGYVARAAPDGYTLLVAGQSSLAFAPHLYAKLPYDSLRDFAPITNVALAPYVLTVNTRVPVKTVAELVKIARSKPQALTFATSGAGSVSHLTMEMLASSTGVDLVHVPYKGMIPAISAMASGEVDMMFADLGLVDALVQAGRLRTIAVAGRARSSSAPSLPTMTEAGFNNVVGEGRFGFLAPAGTPREIVTRLHAVLAAATKGADVRERFAKFGYEPTTDTPEQFAALIKSEHEQFGKLIRQLKIKAD